MQLVLDTDVNEEIKCKMSTIESNDTDEKVVLNGTDEHKTSVANGKLKHLEVCVNGSININSEIDNVDENISGHINVNENKSKQVNSELDISIVATEDDDIASSTEVITNGCTHSAKETDIPATDAIISSTDINKSIESETSVPMEISTEIKSSVLIEKGDSSEIENTENITEKNEAIVSNETILEVNMNCNLGNNTSKAMTTFEIEHEDQTDECVMIEDETNNSSSSRDENQNDSIITENLDGKDLETSRTEMDDPVKHDGILNSIDNKKVLNNKMIEKTETVNNINHDTSGDSEVEKDLSMKSHETDDIKSNNTSSENVMSDPSISIEEQPNSTNIKIIEGELNVVDSGSALISSKVTIVTKDNENNERLVNTDLADKPVQKSTEKSEGSKEYTPKLLETDNGISGTQTTHIVENVLDNKDPTETENVTTDINDETSLETKVGNIHTPKVDISHTETMEVDDDSPTQDKSSEAVTAIADVETDIEVTSAIKDDEEVQSVIVAEEKLTVLETETTKHTGDDDKVVFKPNNICKLSNNLDILSDDEEMDSNIKDIEKPAPPIADVPNENKCINLDDDDDDVMLIDDVEQKESIEANECDAKVDIPEETGKLDIAEETNKEIVAPETDSKGPGVDSPTEIEVPKIEEKPVESPSAQEKLDEKPLVPSNFLKTFKTNVAEMTRDDLEEFCLLKIVEGVIDRSSLSEIKTKLKTLTTQLEEWKKKSMMLMKQNRDLQIVLKTVQEEQKKKPDAPVAPLKITRSVGMQVFMTEPDRGKKKQTLPRAPSITKPSTPVKGNTSPPLQPPIPVPKLVPAQTTPAKGRSPVIQNATVSSNTGKVPSPSLTIAKSPPKQAEKRSHSAMTNQSMPNQSVTVDLTDDEPPAKLLTPRNMTGNSVRLVSPQNLLAPRAQLQNGPRKVFIPINQNNANLRPGHTVMLKPVPPPQNPRQRASMTRMPSNAIRVARAPAQRHPAPLPDCLKQPQPPNWKAIPPSPDLKISKAENGIVISWKIVGYQEDSYEEIASYQLYAYQETSSPPSTMLWKKIGDVKALPLPMACTLTQFMAGYKYYFAVRAVDVRSRIGPFSLPGSILLLNT